MVTRKYHPLDCEILAELFYDTVHTVNVTTDKVTVGYVGIYVNTDFNLTFLKLDKEWILEK